MADNDEWQKDKAALETTLQKLQDVWVRTNPEENAAKLKGINGGINPIRKYQSNWSDSSPNKAPYNCIEIWKQKEPCPRCGHKPELESEAQIRGRTECRAESKKADTGRLLVNIWQTVRRNGDAKGLKYDYCTNCGYCIWWAYDDAG
eukprot:gnl/MRDRNA2_/MRDRNA2_228544_c0_seq1.p1 gnl/MRDRNA2_/MRDRNA2_228544_c0~~gnl/MRDRNA2_/MRDRNA2_228544_c0_seq1.p1  ORF type:complete len:147 (+),score=21.61 gnl/MRDRNA2_/MRDRNA2_228544_c0_seq1:152-592(+)